MASEYHARSRKQCSCCVLDDTNDVDDTELSASVGEGGKNQTTDVLIVQERLNCISIDDGGPYHPLAEDGICGSKTKFAIKHFQQRYWQELLGDGRIDPGKATWNKLVALSDEAGDSNDLAEKKGGSGLKKPSTPATPSNPMIALWFAQYRIYEAIKALDVALTELETIRVKSQLLGGKLIDQYINDYVFLKELPTVDRVFKISHNMHYAHASDVIRRLRKIYSDMIDVIVATMISSPHAEKTGEKKFVRVVSQVRLNKAHPGGAIADAPTKGWWHKNANLKHIRIGSAHLNDDDLITSLIHEMSHFVSHPSTFIVGKHVSGAYNQAFKDTHDQAVKNAFCYEWYALLASFKHLRSKDNDSLELK